MFKLIESMSKTSNKTCQKCGYAFSKKELRFSCCGCNTTRCPTCDEAKCQKNRCERTYCNICFQQGYGVQFCHKCETQCWVCGIIPYPSYPMEKRKVGDMNVVICARHASRPGQMQVFEDFLAELDKSDQIIGENQVKEDLALLNAKFEGYAKKNLNV